MLVDRNPPLPAPLRLADASPAGRVSAGSNLVVRELAGRMVRLSWLERQVLHLVQIEGASYSEAALGLGVDRERVRQLVFAGRHKLLAAAGA